MQLEDEFGDIISKAAIGCGLTAPDLARRVSLSEADLREMMAYRSIPDRHTIDKLACALGLDAQKLDAIANNAWLPNQPDFSDHPFIIQTIRNTQKIATSSRAAAPDARLWSIPEEPQMK